MKNLNEDIKKDKEKEKYNLSFSTGGKVIISGEHSVVYGKPAIAFCIDKHTKINLLGYNSSLESNNFAKLKLLDIKKEINLTKSELIDALNNKLYVDNNNDKYKIHIMNIFTNIFSKLELKSLNKEKITNFLNNNYFIASISSEIPIGFGLGSSAAYNVCLVNSICILFNNLIDSDKKFSKEEILKLSNEGEKIFHNGTPSGIDVSCCSNGGVLIFKNINDKINLNINENNFFLKKIKFLLINTNIKRNGGEFIKIVSDFKKNNSNSFKEAINDIEKVTNEIINLLSKENSDDNDCEKFFDLIRQNQILLKKICVSNNEIDSIINILEKNNFVGKISGAGGGGFIISFCLKERYDSLIKLLDENKIEYMNINISKEPAKLINLKIEK